MPGGAAPGDKDRPCHWPIDQLGCSLIPCHLSSSSTAGLPGWSLSKLLPLAPRLGSEPRGAGWGGGASGGRGAGGPGKARFPGQVQSLARPAEALLVGWGPDWLFAQHRPEIPVRKFVFRLICLLFTLAQSAAPWGGLGRGIG